MDKCNGSALRCDWKNVDWPIWGLTATPERGFSVNRLAWQGEPSGRAYQINVGFEQRLENAWNLVA